MTTPTAIPDDGAPCAWARRGVALFVGTIGGASMYVVVLSAVQAEFGIARADAALPYTFTMIGFGIACKLLNEAIATTLWRRIMRRRTGSSCDVAPAAP